MGRKSDFWENIIFYWSSRQSVGRIHRSQSSLQLIEDILPARVMSSVFCLSPTFSSIKICFQYAFKGGQAWEIGIINYFLIFNLHPPNCIKKAENLVAEHFIELFTTFGTIKNFLYFILNFYSFCERENIYFYFLLESFISYLLSYQFSS